MKHRLARLAAVAALALGGFFAAPATSAFATTVPITCGPYPYGFDIFAQGTPGEYCYQGAGSLRTVNIYGIYNLYSDEPVDIWYTCPGKSQQTARFGATGGQWYAAFGSPYNCTLNSFKIIA